MWNKCASQCIITSSKDEAVTAKANLNKSLYKKPQLTDDEHRKQKPLQRASRLQHQIGLSSLNLTLLGCV